jgi:hypothetical protein
MPTIERNTRDEDDGGTADVCGASQFSCKFFCDFADNKTDNPSSVLLSYYNFSKKLVNGLYKLQTHLNSTL